MKHQMRDSLKRQLNDAEGRRTHNLTVPNQEGRVELTFKIRAGGFPTVKIIKSHYESSHICMCVSSVKQLCDITAVNRLTAPFVR